MACLCSRGCHESNIRTVSIVAGLWSSKILLLLLIAFLQEIYSWTPKINAVFRVYSVCLDLSHCQPSINLPEMSDHEVFVSSCTDDGNL
jgi:hypothetical protein